MNRTLLRRLSVAAVLLALALGGTGDSWAQRRGGGGRSGGARSAPSRPSGSRSAARPSPSRGSSSRNYGSLSQSRPQSSPRPATRPSTRPSSRPTTPTRPVTVPSTRPSTRPGTRPPTVAGTRPSTLPGPRPGTAPVTRPGTVPEAVAGTRPSNLPAEAGRLTPGQRETAQSAIEQRQRNQNVDQALGNRQENIGQITDNRQEIADNVMDHREDIADTVSDNWRDHGLDDVDIDIYAPGWAWATGAAVVTLPAVTTPLFYNDTTYYYTDGHYLEPTYAGDQVVYVVTQPEPGTVVCDGLPSGYETTVVDGVTYYGYGGVWYEAYPEGGPNCYVVVPSQ
jgi:hypothetical protein